MFIKILGIFTIFMGSIICFPINTAAIPEDDNAGQKNINYLKYVDTILDTQIEYGTSGKFYLIADFPPKKIHLMLNGVPLKTFQADKIEFGSKRFLFFSIRNDSLDMGLTFTQGLFYPERVIERYQIIPTIQDAPVDSSKDQKSSTSPLPVEAKKIVVPQIFQVNFKERLCFEIWPSQQSESPNSFISRVKIFINSKKSEFQDLYYKQNNLKIKCFLSPVEAEAFYRIVPENIDMLIVPFIIQ